ncbi:hypothetical protein [Chitinophaga agri]|uniref:Uncharacterized protein n=1 Tax=Chitinophaga agri TaxID=2703787 RepID=A0A6B9ZN32_9BACT|nr:hypothetical protein [Chitinophaga agri]QHS63061.1 hypothetical protein GWR21_26780 [Chitinophaga agri]
MNFIPFPQERQDQHVDLVSWRAKVNKRAGDWRDLKVYVADSCRLKAGIHPITKCWYSELHQGDNYALDVEHVRPKNAAEPLSDKDRRDVERLLGQELLQDVAPGFNYNWLEFEYRNYRIVTALTNRGGAKHIYFPIFSGTNRLSAGSFPWTQEEYPIFLDPVNRHDANQLLVKPNGEIIPKAPQTALTQDDVNDLPATWQSDAFNYIRAIVTIKMYRLNETVFIQGRKEIYDAVRDELENLLYAINAGRNPENQKLKPIIEKTIVKLSNYIMPSAQFSLAARCSMIDYVPDAQFGQETIQIFNTAVRRILDEVDTLVNNAIIDWTKP